MYIYTEILKTLTWRIFGAKCIHTSRKKIHHFEIQIVVTVRLGICNHNIGKPRVVLRDNVVRAIKYNIKITDTPCA